MHEKDIQPVMWIKLPKGKYTFSFGESKTSRTQLDATIHWKHVESIDCSDAAPFLIASFDIECDSHHGDFPLARKDMKKTASEIMDVYEKLKCNKMSREEQIKIVYQMLYRGFYYDTKVESHTLDTHLQDVSKIFTRDEMKPHKNLIKKVAKDAVYFMNNQQNYDLLAIDIIKNVIQEDTIRTSGAIFINKQIEDIIEESFIEDDTIEKKYNIRPVFIEETTNQVKKHLRLVVVLYGHILRK